MITLRVDPVHPDPAVIERAAVAIREGGIVAFPTDTLYGLAVDPFSRDAVRRLFALKGRAASQAIALVAADRTQVELRLGELSPLAGALADGFWPGPLTLIIAASPRLADEVTSGTRRVGVRVPAHNVARLLCQMVGGPVTATSANVSGHQPTSTAAAIEPAIRARIELLLDAGETPGGAPSTIVDVTGREARLVRTGAIAWERIEARLHA
jgi:L-threonylcarbamoyladenylate synthase